MALFDTILMWVIAIFTVNFIAQFLAFIIEKLIKKESLKALRW